MNNEGVRYIEQLLIIEDDIGLNQGLSKALKADDRQIISCQDLKAAKERTKFFLAFRTDHPSLICQYFLTDRTASRVKNISNHVQKPFHFHFLPLFYSLFCYPLYFCISHIIGINFFSVIIQSSDHSLQYHSSPSVLLSPVVSLSSLIRSSSALYLFCCFSLRIISAKVSSFPTTVTHFLALVTAV